MPDSVKFSELPTAADIGGGDLAALAVEDQLAETGYTSKKATIQQLGGFLNNTLEYPTALKTSQKKIIPSINELQDLIIGQLPVDSVSGSLVNFTTSLALPLVALKTYIKAQGGGGTPQDEKPIIGFSEVNLTRAGKNLFNKAICEIGKNWNGSSMAYSIATDFIDLKVGTYKISTSSMTALSSIVIVFFDNTGTYQSSATLTDGNINISTYTKIKLSFRASSDHTWTQTELDNALIQLEVGSNVTAYAPYNADTFTLSLGQTVFGGYVDWGKGKLVITHLYVKMANLTWIGSNGIFENRTSYENLHTAVRGSYTLCDIYDSSGSTSSANMRDKTIQTMGGASSSNFWVKDLDYSTAQDFIDSLGNHEIVYQLATPIEISLPTTMPQTIEGEQNWFVDSGDIEVSFKMGVQEYIDKKIAETQALIL